MLRNSVLGTLLLASAVWAGGVHIFIGDPGASPDPAASGAVLLVQVQGCGNAMNANVRAVATAKSATGAVRTAPMQVVHLSKPETLVLRGDEVKTGEWTVVVTANHLGSEWWASVPLKDGKFERKDIRQGRRPLSQSTD